MKAEYSQQVIGSYAIDSVKPLWCLRPESNRYARFHEAADFKCSVHSMREPGSRMDAGHLVAHTVRQGRVLRRVGQKIPSNTRLYSNQSQRHMMRGGNRIFIGQRSPAFPYNPRLVPWILPRGWFEVFKE